MHKQDRDRFYRDMGFRLRKMRYLRQFSTEQLGERVGVSGKTILRYETGENHLPPMAIQICARALDVPVGYFYGEGDDYPLPDNAHLPGLIAAAEVLRLPNDEIRNSAVQFFRAVNRWSEEQRKDVA